MQTINTDYIQEFTVEQLFHKNGDRFLIPIYQRNYEWGSGQIVQLLEDIRDYYIYDTQDSKNYYIGTLIVNKRDEHGQIVYETIDGQQRLTTFNLIVAVVQKHYHTHIADFDPDQVDFKKSILDFESRTTSKETIDFIFRNGVDKPNFDNFNENIFEAVKIIKDQLEKIEKELKEGADTTRKTFDEFLKYLFEKVILLRVQVPENTDLNHYFEIMNLRGEQLERHEILKAELMSKIKGDENQVLRKIYHGIWEACSRMDTYVQMGFPKRMRTSLFGDRWLQFIPENAEELFETLEGYYIKSESIKTFGLEEILAKDSHEMDAIKKELTEENTVLESDAEYRQFQEVINFENFLLHVLKLTVAEFPEDRFKQNVEVSLDDKKLIDFFKAVLKQVDDEAYFSRVFIYTLLKSRFLLDQYVLKRKYVSQRDEWSLNVIKFYERGENDRTQDSYSYINTFETEEKNNELILLLSMFHVSTPTLSYKNWLFEVLRYLSSDYNFDQNENKLEYPIKLEYPKNIDSDNYINNLRQIAVKFLKYRMLNAEENLNYEQMLDDEILNQSKTSFDSERLLFGNIRSNLVFNFIDYLLWKRDSQKYKDFEFSFRSSVEHYYPQNPRTVPRIEDLKVLNSIGNLCLISHNNNSKLSNHSPAEKRKYYESSKSKDSIKQMVMMEKGDDWNEEEIKSHTNEIHELLQKVVFEDHPITKLNEIYKKESNATFLYKADEE